MPNATQFVLLEFPKEIVEVYLRGGEAPALVLMKKQYPRAKPGWCERAIAWLEKNLERGPEFSPPGKAIVMFKPGDFGFVTGTAQQGKPKPGARVVKVLQVLNQGKVLKVVDTMTNKEHFTLSDVITPKAAPAASAPVS